MKKFDFVVGNPPFDENNDKRNRKDAMYDIFMDASFKISDKVMLITPARFLFNIGSTNTDWNTKMLNDEHFKVLKYFRHSKTVFPGTSITGGIVISLRDESREFEPIKTFTTSHNLKSILNKVENIEGVNNLGIGSLMHVQNKFDLNYLNENHPHLVKKLGSKGKERRLISSIFKDLNEIFYNNVNNEDNYFRIVGRQDNIRVKKWIYKDFIEENNNLYKFKVILPSANGSDAIGGSKPTPVIGIPLIGEPNEGHTQTFISIGSFDTKAEAENCMKYIKSKFFRTMLGIKKVTQNNKSEETFSKIPNQDFTGNSDIDWTKSIAEIDQQLYKKYGLSDDEIAFIEEKVQEME